MSEDELSEPYDPIMKLYIENLMGTTFKIRMYSTNTVLDLKNKIQRIEGIPVSHQNLLYKMSELQDYKRICDTGVVNGSTLKLVLSMRGGPISTRRLSDHQIIWKDLNDLNLNKDNAFGNSKVSLLVFKEGEVINLVRVIENEDGSYSPYNKNKTTSDSGSTKSESHLSFFKKITEDMDMAIKIQMLKLKLKNMSLKKELRNKKRQENIEDATKTLEDYENYERDISNLLNYLETRKELSNRNIEKSFKRTYAREVSDSEEEHEYSEVALKEKHRSKFNLASFSQHLKRLDETKNALGKTECKRLSPKEKRDNVTKDSILSKSFTSERLLKPNASRTRNKFEPQNSLSEPFSIIKEHAENENVSIEVPCSESISLSSRADLSRLHISEEAESLDLDNPQQDLWEIHPRESLKHNKTYNLGLITNHIGLEHNYNIKNNLSSGDNNDGLDDDFFEGDFCNLSRLVSPTTIPFSSKDNASCDTYFEVGNSKTYNRLPLYGRQTKLNLGTSNKDNKKFSSFYNSKACDPHVNYIKEIKTLENKYETEEIYDHATEIDDIFQPKNENFEFFTRRLSKVTEKTESSSKKEETKTPAVSLGAISKKTMRCSHCKKRLSVVNIYNCRCGKIFCGQHRYSEAHNCEYDYKTEGKKLLEQTNPLVVAKKLDKI